LFVQSVSLNCKTAVIATATAQGIVEIYDAEMFKPTKKRIKDTPLFAMATSEKDNVYKFEDVTKRDTKPLSKTSTEKRTFTPITLGALRVQWNPNKQYENWLLASYAMGIVMLKKFDK
jgi:hypothetical protein